MVVYAKKAVPASLLFFQALLPLSFCVKVGYRHNGLVAGYGRGTVYAEYGRQCMPMVDEGDSGVPMEYLQCYAHGRRGRQCYPWYRAGSPKTLREPDTDPRRLAARGLIMVDRRHF